jgi:hypothetical protein
LVESATRVRDLTLSDSSRLTLETTGGAPFVARVLGIDPAAQLRSGDRDLIIDHGAVSQAAQVIGHVVAGRIEPDGDVGGLPTTLAVSVATDLGLSEFAGVAVDESATLLKYTYVGDANLDGQVDALDYERVDLAIGDSNVLGVAAGDLNYDTLVNALDYELIDLNIGNGVGNGLATGAVVSVPEAGAMWVAGLALIGAGRAGRTRAASRLRLGFGVR